MSDEMRIDIQPGGQGRFTVKGGDYDGRVGFLLGDSDVLILKIDTMTRCWVECRADYDTPSNRAVIVEALRGTALHIEQGGPLSRTSEKP